LNSLHDSESLASHSTHYMSFLGCSPTGTDNNKSNYKKFQANEQHNK